MNEDRIEFGSPSEHDIDAVDTNYALMEELDEESISWNKLITRIVCIVLFILIIITIYFGATKNQHVYYLVVIFAVSLIIIFMCSFMDIECFKSTYIWRGRFITHNTGDRDPSNTSDSNSDYSSNAVSPIHNKFKDLFSSRFGGDSEKSNNSEYL